jgi:hypothetical protein
MNTNDYLAREREMLDRQRLLANPGEAIAALLDQVKALTQRVAELEARPIPAPIVIERGRNHLFERLTPPEFPGYYMTTSSGTVLGRSALKEPT